MDQLKRLAVAVALVGTAPVGGVLAQAAQPGRFEIPGLDWGPRSAWRVRAALVSARRSELLRSGNLRALNASQPFFAATSAAAAATATAVTGAFFVPVVALAYSDVAAPFTTAEYGAVLFSTPPHPEARPYSLKTYYEEVSGHRITMDGRVFDVVRVDSTAGYYQQNCNGISVPGRTSCPDGGRRMGLMLLSALDSISNRAGGDTVWSQFDNDGPDGVPNSGDDDGDVDFITFLQPVKDGACQPSSGIWAHRWVMSAWNNGSKYVTKTPRRNSSGQPIPGQFIRVENYTIQSQVGGTTACDAPAPGAPAAPSQIMSIGIVSHETGHAFGLPDLYDVGGPTQGAGEWSMMASGIYTKPTSPATYDAWSLNELGWITIDSLGSGRTVTTGPRQLTDTVFLARTKSNTEYVLVENRQSVRTDTANFDPAQPITDLSGGPCRSRCRKLPGLLLWHIDLTQIAAGRPSNRINTGPIHGVALVQADGSNDLRRSGGNRGDRGDSYPGLSDNTGYTLASSPAARTNGGSYTGFIIDNIEQRPAAAMRFRFLRRDPSVVEPSFAPINLVVNGDRLGRFEEVMPPGTQLVISADEVQEVFSGRSRGRFRSWSNGGPRSQTVISGPIPDTLVADYAVEHRAAATTGGSGTGMVAANVAGNPLAGIFLPQGTPVTLTAVPAAGSVFGGWRGDTAASTASITLPMGRPYDLEASFVAEVAVAVTDATAEVLGTPRLSTEQKIFLDQLGNRNGLFDLGDYLALLRRNGQAAPAAVIRAAATASRTRGN
jgi:M6 family metalloprotease-like protein